MFTRYSIRQHANREGKDLLRENVRRSVSVPLSVLPNETMTGCNTTLPLALPDNIYTQPYRPQYEQKDTY